MSGKLHFKTLPACVRRLLKKAADLAILQKKGQLETLPELPGRGEAMEYMTAEQAAEAAKGLTFEIVWAALMETRQRMEESQQRIERNIEALGTQLDTRIGGLGNSLGRLAESILSANLTDKFDEFGFEFETQSNNKEYKANKQPVAEVDAVLENGAHVMLVEIKTDLSSEDIDDHLKRIGKIRRYMDDKGDQRNIVGAVAGGVVRMEVQAYAQRKGLFVITHSGDATTICKPPEGFKVREWAPTMSEGTVSEALGATCRHAAASPEPGEAGRKRLEAPQGEALALSHAERQSDEHWQGVLAAALADRDAALASMEHEIACLRERLGE